MGVDDLFHHALAVLHDPAYREANAGALRMEWPRIPMPGWPDGDSPGAAAELSASAGRGRELAPLLDPETPVPGVTVGELRPELATIAVPTTADGRNMTGDDFAVTAGWGHFGTGAAVMPGQGRAVERLCNADELAALGDAAATLGDSTFNVYLNSSAYWQNIPNAVWNYKLGGYQVLKKMALLPRARSVRQATPSGRSAALHRHGAADWGDTAGHGGVRVFRASVLHLTPVVQHDGGGLAEDQCKFMQGTLRLAANPSRWGWPGAYQAGRYHENVVAAYGTTAGNP